ncbi:MAG: antibiotic biosynthesis monooxygenase, partial [Gammaproteobacteria bacterium]|nr:antibiotic biosynthesis monooxygenase [Gammaproteobacteria bacterium]
MHTTLVYVYVKPEFVDAFITATEKNHRASIEEPGNRRFDLIQEAAEPNKFILYEAYTTAAAAA